MHPLYTNREFLQAKSRQKLPLRCKYCKKTFHKTKHHIQDCIRSNRKETGNFCSISCQSKYHRIGHKKLVKCHLCNKPFEKDLSRIKKTKHNFCSKSCAVTYNNMNKKHGSRRSKLEIWIEQQLSKTYPHLKIHFNKTDAINSELDIHIPSLQIAFELNGIFHYEPIYGQTKLASIQNNDERKFQACLEKEIELCIIDTSSQKYFKPKSAQKFLEIILSIINTKLSSR